MNFLILKDGFIINFDKSKELVLHRPHVTRHYLPQSLAGIEQVLSVRLLGVIFQSSLSFAAHVDYVLKVCSQRIFFTKTVACSGDATRTVAYSLPGNYSAMLSLCSSSLVPFPQCCKPFTDNSSHVKRKNFSL